MRGICESVRPACPYFTGFRKADEMIRTQRRKPGSEAFKTRAVLVEEARKRLRRTYDDSARELGFIPGPKYSVWKNPDYVPWWKNIWKRRGIVETHNCSQ